MKSVFKKVLSVFGVYRILKGVKFRAIRFWVKINTKKQFSHGGYVGRFTKNLVVVHDAGFFSCCSIRLQNIIEYYNYFGEFPVVIDGKAQFKFYKRKEHGDVDISPVYFKEISEAVSVKGGVFQDVATSQFKPYGELMFDLISPLVERYFSPSPSVLEVEEKLTRKYELNYENLCCVCYRGNDKSKETNIPSYGEMLEKMLEVRNQNPGIKFLIQTDEEEFYEYLDKKMPGFVRLTNGVTINKDLNSGVHLEKNIDLFKESIGLLAIIRMISRSRYIICTSSNVSLWILYYRGNAVGVSQYLSHKKEIYGIQNPAYTECGGRVWQE